MNLNGEFEELNTEGEDVIITPLPDLPVDEENQPVVPENPEVEIVQEPEPIPETNEVEVIATENVNPFLDHAHPNDLNAMTALDDSLKTSVSESDVFPDPGDVHFNLTPQSEAEAEAEVLISFGDVTDELSGIAALEDAFQDLEYVTDGIANMGGINQAIATEAAKCIPDFFVDRPLGFYTKTPTATNLKYAMEAIDLKKAGIIAAIFAAVMAAFYKVYKWFTSDTGGPLSKKEKGDIKKDAEEIKEAAEKMGQRFEKANRSTNGGIDELMQEVAKAKQGPTRVLLNDIDGVTADLLSPNSVLKKKIQSLFKENGGLRGFQILIHDVEAALDSVYETAKKQISSHKLVDAIPAESHINDIIKGLHPAMSEMLGTLRYNGKNVPLDEIHRDLRDTVSSLNEQRQKVSNFLTLIRNIDSLVHSEMAADFDSINDLYKTALVQLNPKLEQIQKTVTEGKVETENHISSSPNYRGKKEVTDAVRRINNIILELAGIASVCYQILIVRPKACTKNIHSAYVEAKKYLEQLLAEKSADNDGGKNDAEIERLNTYLKAFEEEK